MGTLLKFGGYLIGGLAVAMPSLIGRILIALGIGFVTYQGISVLSDWIYNDIINSFVQIPPAISRFLGWLWLDKAITMIFSAWTAALALKLGTNGTISKMIIK